MFFFNSDPEEAFKTLSDLQDISKPLLITFREMRTLMSQCQEIDAQTNFNKGSMSSKKLPGVGRGILTNNPLTLFSGIIPGSYQNCACFLLLFYYFHQSPQQAILLNTCKTFPNKNCVFNTEHVSLLIHFQVNVYLSFNYFTFDTNLFANEQPCFMQFARIYF